MTKQLSSHQDELFRIKEFLIANNPAKINDENKNDILTKFEQNLGYLIQYIKDGLPDLNESTRLIFPDTFSICLLRSHQIIASKKIDSEKYLSVVSKDILTVTNSNVIFEYVLDYWADGGAPLTNALRDLFGKLLNLLKVIYPVSVLKDILFNWMNEILEIPSTLRVQYYLIDALSSNFDLYYILEKKPNFIENSFSLMCSDLLANPVGKCIVSLLINVYRMHFKDNESFVEEWIQLWKNPALKYIHDSRYTKSINLYVMIPLFKNMPNKAFTSFLKQMPIEDPSLLLSLLKIGQELGIEEEPFHDNKYATIEFINKLLEQDEFKLQVFEILTFSTKKSKPIHPYIFKIIKQHLNAFFVDTELERRNYFCSSMKHFIFRVRDCTYSLARDAGKLKKAGKFPDEQKEKLTQVEESRVFLAWLCDYIKHQLAPGSLYQCNVTALKLLHILIKSGIDKMTPHQFLDNQNKREYPFSITVLQDVTFLRLLTDLLVNNFADVRELSKELLFMMISADESKQLLNTINMNSLERTADSLLNKYEKGDAGATVYEFIFTITGSQGSFVDRTIETLSQMVRDLHDDNIGCANNSIGAHFAALSAVLDKYNFEENTQDTSNIVSKSIDLVLANWEATKSVVCHDSANGILPEKYINCGVPDQVIISHAFRAIKEASDLIETILKRYPLTSNQLNCIGDLFTLQLSTIRHSGAFQAVLPGLRTYCFRCQLESPAILEELLTKSMKSLESKTQHITRRSGGLPFLVTTVLSAEVTKGRPLLQRNFKKLLSFAKLPVPPHQDEFDLPQVNAINCINAIFVEPKLSEHCTPFVSDALEIALLNFDCDIWALRNCSIMLFTSLQNRIFGKVGRSVSAKLFFTKYSGLRSLLLDILNISVSQGSSDEKENYKVESIFLILNVLLRLRPTPGYTGLNEFSSLVYKCLSSVNWKIRDMASRVLNSLSENPEEETRKLLDLASTKRQNQLHAHLLALQHIAPQYLKETNDSELIQKIFEKKKEFLVENKCFVTQKAYLELTRSILGKNCGTPEPVLEDYIRTLRNVFTFENDEYAVNGSKQLYLAQVLDFLLEYEDSAHFEDIYLLGLYSPFYEVQLKTLQHMDTRFTWITTRSSEFLEKLQILLQVDNLLPMAKALVVKILSRKEGALSLSTSTNLIEMDNSEETKLSAISSLSAQLSSKTFNQIWSLMQEFFSDSCSKDFRLASLNCLIAYTGSDKNFKILIQIFNFLWDDDSEIREKASFYLNKNFIQSEDWECNKNIGVTTLLFTKKFAEIFTGPDVIDELWSQLFQYVNVCDIFAAEKSATNILFTTEKDNQFINDLERAMRLFDMIKLTAKDIPGRYKDKISYMKDTLIEHFNNENTRDCPVGWCSNVEVFSRITLLKTLIESYFPSEYVSFIDELTRHCVHPLIISFSQF
ncbi:hypothetical protein SUVZ_13G3890 [Saccharomyces uvarum]|uniref:DUF2428 domain-containing protein n=1 Tax=Saccharomyces uvarum TaxID=230603 RepID=A0ABN8WML5_SACUV|nr:hypothetical protein SUVZ_13G3890 [Saccharomyces uvarum]